MNGQQDSMTKLLLDVPEKEAILGFEEYASALVSAILGTEPHFTIGIFGKWGSGKTTLLRKIEGLLKSSYSDKVLAVFFDAWRYQREEHMLLPILNTLSESLRREETKWSQLGNEIKRLTKSMAAAITLKSSNLEIDPQKAMNQWESAEQIRSDYFGWLNELQKILEDTRRDDADRRIVVMIDDLDRCVPQKLVEVLESIKVMLDVSGFIFVLALDPLLVEKAVESHYGQDYGVSGRDYIKKLVQVEFRLPPLRTQDVVKYAEVMHQRIAHIDEEASQALAEVVPMVVGDNPREAKRFINGVLLATSVMKRVGVTVPVNYQIAFMAMQSGWPGVVRDLASDKSIRKLVKEHVEAKLEKRTSSLSEKEGKIVGEMFDNNLGLESYLERSAGKELLNLSDDDFSELVYYTSMSGEKKKFEAADDLVDDVLSTLNDRERRIIQLRFGFEGRARSLAEIGQEFQIGRGRVSQISAKAIRKLRHPARARKLLHLLPSMDELSESSRRLLSAIFGSEWNQSKMNSKDTH